MIKVVSFILAFCIAIEPISNQYRLLFNLSISQLIVFPVLFFFNFLSLVNYKSYTHYMKKHMWFLIVLAYGLLINFIFNDFWGGYKIFSTIVYSILCIGFFNFFYDERGFALGIFVGLLLTLFSFTYNYFSGNIIKQYLLYSGVVYKATGLIGDTNASALIILILLAMFSRSSNVQKKFPIVFWGFVYFAILIGFLAFSRTYFIVILSWILIRLAFSTRRLIGFLAWHMTKRELKVILFSIIGLSCIAIILYKTGLLGYMYERFLYDTIKRGHLLGSRHYIWEMILSDFRNNLLFGGSFHAFLNENFGQFPHNTYLEVSLYGGLPLLFWLMFHIVNGSRLIFSRDEKLVNYASFLIACSIFILTLSFFYKILITMFLMIWIPCKSSSEGDVHKSFNFAFIKHGK